MIPVKISPEPPLASPELCAGITNTRPSGMATKVGAPFRRMTFFVWWAMSRNKAGISMSFAGRAPKILSNSRRCGVRIAVLAIPPRNDAAPEVGLATVLLSVAMAFSASASMTIGHVICDAYLKNAFAGASFPID